MNIDLWPIVGRSQLVQAFRPGEPYEKEAPFRTLRTHGWATPGVSVVTRTDHRASGRLTIFSVLNVAAARSAREGHHRSARALAKAAAKVEKSTPFVQLKELLSGRPIAEVTAALEGGVSETRWPQLLDALRRVARETANASTHQTGSSGHTEVVTGRILEALRDVLVLQAETGMRTYVPRWLAQSARRENVGDLLALVTDRLDDMQMVVRAVPAIDMGTKRDASPTPFGRTAPVRELIAADARLLRGTPAPLKILVPVTIEG